MRNKKTGKSPAYGPGRPGDLEVLQRYRRLVEGLKTEYFFYQHGRDGVFNYVSPSVRNVLGYAPENFLRHYTRYMTDNPANQEVLQRTKKSLRGVKQPPYRVEMLHKNGTPRWLEVLEVPVKDGRGRVVSVEGIAHDITARVKAREELELYRNSLEDAVEERTAELKAVFDRTPLLLLVLDEDLKVVRTNSASHPRRLIGEVLRCARAGGGRCGRAADCANCQVRRAVSGTLRTGRAVSRMEVSLGKAPGGMKYFLLSSAIIPGRKGRHLLVCLDDITGQKRVEESLRKSEEFRRLILSSVGDGIIGVDTGGRVLFMNEAAEAMLGWTLEELRSKKIHAAIHAKRPDGSRYPLSDCPMFAAYSAGKESVVQDEMLWRRDGTGFYVRYSARPMHSGGSISGAVITFSDVTERRRMEEELRANKERLQTHNAALTELGRSHKSSMTGPEAAFGLAVDTLASALDVDRVSLWLLSEDGSALVCKAGMARSGRPAAPGDLLKAADFPAFFRLLKDEGMLVSDDISTDFRLREMRETVFKPLGVASGMQAPIFSGGRPAGLLAAFRHGPGPLRPWLPDEQSLLGAVADFVALALTSAEKKKLEDMKDFLTHTIVHDLKNPLAAISLAGQMLFEISGRKLPRLQRENLSILNQEATEMGRMISNILDINRIEEGKMPVKAEPFDPHEILKQAAKTLGIQAAHSGKKIVVRPASLPGAVVGDAALLARVAENLLANALRYAPSGSAVEAGVEEGEGGGAVFYVQDRGPGIPAEYREAVFEKFTQLDDDSRRKWGGKGLGLAFCKLAVEAHGGRIWVESSPGQGSVFRFSVPPPAGGKK